MTNLKEYLDEDVKSLLEKKDFKFDDFKNLPILPWTKLKKERLPIIGKK